MPPGDHDQPGSPYENAVGDEFGERDAVDEHREDGLQPVHFVDVGEPGDRESRQHHDPDAAAEVTAVGGDGELQRERPERHRPVPNGVRSPAGSKPRRQPAAEREGERRHQHQPRQEPQEARVRRPHKEIPSEEPAHKADAAQEHQGTVRRRQCLAGRPTRSKSSPATWPSSSWHWPPRAGRRQTSGREGR